MPDVTELSPRFAHRILDRLGSTGQPPERGAHFVNVGTDEYLDVLLHEYLRPIKERVGNSTFKLVQAPFGGGKTQFLHCLRELAWQEGFATALVGLSPKECPFDRSDAIYREVARRIEFPPKGLEDEPAQGLDVFLDSVAEAKVAAAGKAAFSGWVDAELRDAQIESRPFKRAVHLWFRAWIDGERDDQDLLSDYLMGLDVPKESLRAHGLSEVFDASTASRWLRSLAQLVATLDLPGIVFLFDEMDRNLSLSVKRRRAVGDTLREMIDHCGQSYLPGVIWCYAVPPEFMDTVVPEYPALAQRLKGALPFSSSAHMQPIIDLDRLPLEAAALYRAIGAKLLAVAERAHGWSADAAVQAQNLRALGERFDAMSLESGTRRRFVKAAASMLEQQRREGEHELDEPELARYVASAPVGAIADLDDEEIF